MNPLMNSVGSNAEEKLNCINAVVITHKGVGQETCSFFVCGAKRVTVKDFLQSITDSRVA